MSKFRRGKRSIFCGLDDDNNNLSFYAEVDISPKML